jgi:hypothetical protein
VYQRRPSLYQARDVPFAADQVSYCLVGIATARLSNKMGFSKNKVPLTI